jgi:large subunit ribosomal protein L18e
LSPKRSRSDGEPGRSARRSGAARNSILRRENRGNPYITDPGRAPLITLRKAAKEHDAPVWGAVAERLARSRHQVDPINVGHLERLVPEGATVVVPGKLLAHGRLTHPITVAAYRFSGPARAKIAAAGGHSLTISELLKSKPNGSGVRLYA